MKQIISLLYITKITIKRTVWWAKNPI